MSVFRSVARGTQRADAHNQQGKAFETVLVLKHRTRNRFALAQPQLATPAGGCLCGPELPARQGAGFALCSPVASVLPG